MNEKERKKKQGNASLNGHKKTNEDQKPTHNKLPEEEKEEESEDEDPEAKFNDLNNKYLRLYSEFDNFRRRTAKEKLEMMQSAGAEVIANLLTVLDDFERAAELNKESDDMNAIKEGTDLIYNKFRETLVSQGLKEIDAMGKPFDMDFHEAITKMKAPKKKQKGKVLDVIEKGYYLNDKVIRFAKVVVGE